MNEEKTRWQVFRWPTVLGALTLVGLLSALMGEGLWDSLAWLLLAIPVGVGVAQGLLRRHGG
jgi:hypothetical protein